MKDIIISIIEKIFEQPLKIVFSGILIHLYYSANEEQKKQILDALLDTLKKSSGSSFWFVILVFVSGALVTYIFQLKIENRKYQMKPQLEDK